MAVTLQWKEDTFSGFVSPKSRARMVERLREKCPSSEGLERVLCVMEKTPRHLFMDEVWHRYAYQVEGLTSLPLGFKQTISQPMSVARMSAFLCDHCAMRRVLEIGTGSGYQACVLAQLADQVYTIERMAPLSEKAKGLLQRLGVDNIHFHHGDGHQGWPTPMLFDGIIVTAAPEKVPAVLLKMLASDGALVVPEGSADAQRLTGYVNHQGVMKAIDLGPVAFVPMLED